MSLQGMHLPAPRSTRRGTGAFTDGCAEVAASTEGAMELDFDLSDAFCVLPGGLGTLEELFEVVTWRQLGMHDKPIIVLNAEGYWDKLVGMIDGIIDDGFAQPSARQYFSVVNSVGRLFDLLENGLACGIVLRDLEDRAQCFGKMRKRYANLRARPPRRSAGCR